MNSTRSTRLTIGQLARRVGLRTSTLRYYEELELLVPSERTAAGYRLYDPSAERTLRFVQRAQRLGFSLADIRHLMQADQLSDSAMVRLAEERFLELERRLTELLVLRHELEHLLRELHKGQAAGEQKLAESLFDRLLDQVCANPLGVARADSILDWLAERTNCILAASDIQSWLAPLEGCHVHIWQVEDGYHVLVVSQDPTVGEALHQLARLEARCQVHSTPQVRGHEEGYLFVAAGGNAFVYAQLFLALESRATP